jgi:hypothetical protein
LFYRSATAWFLGSFGNVFLSVVLGAIAMGFFWFYFPDQFVQLQRSASVTREWIAARAWSNRTESIIRFLLEDRQLLLMAFVVVVRLALNLIALPIRALFARVGIS